MNIISTKFKAYILAALVLVLGLFLRKCNVDPKPNPTDIKLQTDDNAKVIVGKNKITVVRRDKDGNPVGETKFIPDHATVTIKKNGNVEFTVKQIGLQFEPGIGVMGYSNGGALALDTQFAYWKRIGFTAGLGVQMKSKPDIIPFVAASYRLPWDVVSNTSVTLGYAPLQKSPVIGLRVRF